MSKQTIEMGLQLFDERYYKHRIEKDKLDIFGAQLQEFIKEIDNAIEENESEEHIKGIIEDFLKNTFYRKNDYYDINTYKRADSAIKYRGILHAIIETKNPNNRVEMIRENNINKKALWELVFYYLMETRDTEGTKVRVNTNSEIRRLIITDSQEWIVINAQDLDKICNGYLEKQYYKYKNELLSFSNTDKFYSVIEEYFNQINITNKLNYVYFRLDEIYKHKKEWQYLYKILHPAYIIKDGYKQLTETHVLNNKFYKELLYIMGLKEEKINGKKKIVKDNDISNSLIGQTMSVLIADKDYDEEIAKEHAFQLVIIWINRLLFIKLFEGQLLAFNGESPYYHILDNDKIRTFAELQDLFFEVFGKNQRKDSDFINQFSEIPYLNSSLFERYEIEKNDINIRTLENNDILVKDGTVVGKRIKKLPLLQYIISFLNAYNFSTQIEADNGIKKKNEIIDASVLGLIFEKINGYKEGSFYTKGFVTEYICKETIENTLLKKINDTFGWKAKTIEDLKYCIDLSSVSQIKEINDIINNVRICDPAVGSGHFLVSAMNCIIKLKKELGVLMKCDNNGRFIEYEIAIVDDVLCVFDGQGNEFKYDKNNALSQVIQKTLFNEKRTIIENCLFGVDINSNAVAICQLRLWIELLKNAYYENGIMETLPNIDINIKCGNSLIHKTYFEIGKKLGSKNITTLTESQVKQIRNYKQAVKNYKSTSEKIEKNKIKQMIDYIRKDLRMAFSQVTFTPKEDGILIYESLEDRDNLFDIYKNGFEWAIEFPEIIDEDGTFVGFDCIVGNPPYIRVQELAHKEIDYYKNTYLTAWKRIDISMLFIELAYSLVKNAGRVSFITSNQFITAEYGRKLRKFLTDRKFVNHIVDFGDLPVFDGALTYVSIFFMQKQKYNNNLKYYKVSKLPFVSPTDKQYIDIKYVDLSDEKWELESSETKICLEKIKKASTKVLRDYAISWNGAITGCDEVLMFDISDDIPIEDELLKTVIRAESCSRYGIATPSKIIFYPYTENGEETQIIPLDDIKQYYPQAYNYIMNNEEKLKSRKDSRKKFGDKSNWYGLIRFGKISGFKQEKIVSPCDIKHNKFCIDNTGSAFSYARVLAVNIENKEMDIMYLLALLNSNVCEFYMRKVSPLKAGGFYEYKPTELNEMPVVLDKQYKERIIEIAKEIIKKRKDNEDCTDKEKELNEIIYGIYNLDDKDIKVIENELQYKL